MSQTNEHRLYEALSKFLINWIAEENKTGRKPFQSEVIGALEMVKMDIYLVQAAESTMNKKLVDLFGKIGQGKEIRITPEGIIVQPTAPEEN